MARERDGHAMARRRGRGQAITEMALITPLFLIICLGILDLGRAFYGYERIQNAAREGAAWLSLRPDTASRDDVALRVQSEGILCDDGQGVRLEDLGGGFTGADRVDFDSDGNLVLDSDGGYVQVTVACPFDLVTPIMGSLLGSTPPCEVFFGMQFCQPNQRIDLRGRALMPVVVTIG